MNTRALRLAAATLACLVWSGEVIAAKLSYDSMGPMALGFVRFALSAAVFFAIRPLLRERQTPNALGMKHIALTGLVGTSFYYALENYSLTLIPASTASLIVGSFPAMALALECVIDKVHPQPLKITGISLAFLGVAILAIGEGKEGGRNVLLGSFLLIVAGLCWCLYNFAMRLVMDTYSTVTITTWQTLFGALGFMPFVLVEGLPSQPPSSTAWASIAFLVLVCTTLAYVLYNWALEELEPSTVTSLSNLIPVFGLILSALILHEQITVLQVIGGAIVVIGIMLSSQEYVPDVQMR